MAANFVVGLAIAVIILLLLWSIKGLLLTPVSRGKSTDITITLRIAGSEPELEHTLKGLVWLRDNGTLKADIIIDLLNSDDITGHIARTYAENYSYITLSEHGEIYGRAN